MTAGPRRGLFIAPFDELADPRLLAELAGRAEEIGWDGLFLWDHVQYRGGVGCIADAWIASAAIATATERVWLGPLVTPLARRRPWVLARQAVSLDRLSGGRLVLGLGVGGDDNGEMAELGEEPEMRVRAEKLDEGLDLLGAIFSGEAVEFHGRHYSLTARPFLPRPLRPSGIPIWLGIRWPAAPRPLDRAARQDGVFPLEIVPDVLPILRERLADSGAVSGRPYSIVAMVSADADLSA